MKCMIRKVQDHKTLYECLAFVCPGCIEFGGSGLHMLSIDPKRQPTWEWNRDLARPTLSPSILTGKGSEHICHSHLNNGIFEFLSDCTHSLADQHIEMPDLPGWFIQEELDD